jgi:hypothetical protein
MELFPILDQVLIDTNNRPARPVSSLRLWPSEASAVLFDQSKDDIVGKCHRASFLRMIGYPVSNPIDPKGARIFALGKACENNVVANTKAAGIFVASGVRAFSTDVDLSFELDLVIIDKATGQGYIIENKSIYGYVQESNLNKGEPKVDGIMQICLYLNEIPTGKALKETIAACKARRQELQEVYLKLLLDDPEMLNKETRSAWGRLQMYRMEVDEENLALLSDGPLLGKTAYESRGSCDTWEFDVSITQDPFSGLHYPTVAKPGRRLERWDRFTIESIYERYRKLGEYWWAARHWAEAKAASQGHTDSTAPDYESMVASAYQDLPVALWPPAEYEWRYSTEKIHKLYTDGLLSKTDAKKWEAAINPKRRKEHVLTMGSWRCSYCAFKQVCVPMEYPHMQFVWNDSPDSGEDDQKEAA